MNKEQFIKERVKILVSKQGYSKAQATAIAAAQYNKEQQPAQQGKMFNQQIPQQNFTIPNLNQLPNQEYDFSYNGFNPQPVQNNTAFGQPSTFSNYSIPQQPAQPIQSFQNYNQAQNKQEVYNNSHNPSDYMRGDANLDGSVNSGDKVKEVYTTNSVNIVNPNEGFGDPMYNLNRGLYNIGKGNTGTGIAGLGAFALGVARNGLGALATGKNDLRVEQEYDDKRFDRTPNYYAAQQGGKIYAQGGQIENKMYQTGNSNVNAEDGEIVLQDGQIAEVDGKRHLNQNGKNIGGTDIQVQEGAKIVSDADMPTQKITEGDKTVIDDMYGIKVKKGITHADAVRELLKPLSIKKENRQLEVLAEKLKKANKIKDRDTKDLSVLALQKEYSKIKEKVDNIEQERAERTNFVFENIQEPKPKQGDGTQLFDKNGKVVEETGEDMAQQGGALNQKDVNRINQNRTIKNIQSGVSNDKYGDGKYIYYDKLPTDQGFNVNKNREFVTDEAYANNVLNSPAYQAYMRGNAPDKRVAELQQGGDFESIAQKYNISPERARELISMQSGGEMPQEEAPDQMQQIFQAVAQMMQKGLKSEQIAQQLVKMGVPEEQVGQVIQEVTQQMHGQSPQEEQMEGQYSNEQEEGMEMAQQGGQKMYAQSGYNFSTKLTPNIDGFDVTGKSVINKDELKDVEDWQSFREGLGYGKQVAGVKDFTGVHSWYFDTPEKIEAFKKAVVKKGQQPEVEAFQKAYNQEIEKRGKSAGLSDENIKSALDKVGFSKTGVQKEDGLFGAFTSTRPLYSFSKKDGVIETKVDAAPTPTEDSQQVETRNNVKNYLANFPSYMPPQFAMQSYAKESYNPALDYAKKMSVEPFSQQMASKYGMEEAKLEQSGLSTQQLAGMRGNMFSSMLGAENDMNFKVSEYSANDQQKVDFANTLTMNRAQIMNSQYNQDYMNKVMQTIAANEESQKNDYRTNFMQNQVNSNKVIDMNTANALNNNFAITPNGVVPLDNKAYEFKPDFKQFEAIRNMSPEEYNAYKKMMGAKGIKV